MADQLTDRQKAFIDHYLICKNATEAAKLAGYSGKRTVLAVTGHDNLRNPNIRKAIDARMAELTMTANEVLYRLSEHAAVTIEHFVDADGKPDFKKAKRNGVLHLVKEIEHTTTILENGATEEKVKLKLHDAQAALVHLGKYHKLFVERRDITSGGDKIKMYTVVSPDDWDNEGESSE